MVCFADKATLVVVDPETPAFPMRLNLNVQRVEIIIIFFFSHIRLTQ